MDKKSQMMQCLNFICPEHDTCMESKPHTWSKWCDVSGYYGQKTDVLCPKCIDITCKSCDGKGYATLPYVEPSPKDKVCTIPIDRTTAEKAFSEHQKRLFKEDVAPQPEPMPLIKADDYNNFGLVETDYDYKSDYNAEIYIRLEAAKLQRDADMKVLEAKVQQVRKDFAEECIKGMEPQSVQSDIDIPYWNGAQREQLAKVIAHLRAMAKE
jgi:hypothetical protein